MLDNQSDITSTLRLDSLESTTKKLSLKIAENEKSLSKESENYL